MHQFVSCGSNCNCKKLQKRYPGRCRNITCSTCGLVFENQSALNDYLKYNGNKCGLGGETSGSRKITMKKFTCHKCGAKFKFEGPLNNHILISDCENLVCKLCGMRFKKTKYLKRHMGRVHSDQPSIKQSTTCDQCGRKCKDTYRLALHKRIHNEDYLTCKHCKKSFQNRGNVVKHERICSLKDKSLQCPYCRHEFKSEDGLRKHIDTFHLDVPKFANMPRFQCKDCNSEFGSLEALNAHTRRHTFRTCENCGKSVMYDKFFYHRRTCIKKNKKKLKRHTPIKCGLCKKLVEVSTVASHFASCHKLLLLSEPGAYPEKVDCDLCKGSFPVHGYATHVQAEVAKELFISQTRHPEHCVECNANFGTYAYQHHLVAHMGKDDLEKVVKKINNQKGAETSSRRKPRIVVSKMSVKLMNENIKSNSDGPFFKCEECGREFLSQRELTVHCKNHQFRTCDNCGGSVKYNSFRKHCKICVEKSSKRVKKFGETKCGLCGQTFAVEWVVPHLAACHKNLLLKGLYNDIPEKLKCSWCEESIDAMKYASHVQSEVVKDLFVSQKMQPEYCVECDAYFGPSAYQYHMVAHMGMEDLEKAVGKVKSAPNNEFSPNLSLKSVCKIIKKDVADFDGRHPRSMKPGESILKKKKLRLNVSSGEEAPPKKRAGVKFPCELCLTFKESAAEMQDHYLKEHDLIIPLEQNAKQDECCDEKPIDDQTNEKKRTRRVPAYQCFICGTQYVCDAAARFCIETCSLNNCTEA